MDEQRINVFPPGMKSVVLCERVEETSPYPSGPIPVREVEVKLHKVLTPMGWWRYGVYRDMWCWSRCTEADDAPPPGH